jgi:histone deacetylase 1/2
MKSAYSGQDRVNIGNGTCLRIQHIGHSYFTSPSCCKPVILHNLLHVPSITKNLLSVSKFACDNRVFFEFYSNNCNVKHQDTNETFLRGQIKDGLYVFPQFWPFKHASAYSAVAFPIPASFQLWHCHPSARVVKSVLSSCNIPCKQTSYSLLCQSCCMGKAHQLPFTDSETVYHSACF